MGSVHCADDTCSIVAVMYVDLLMRSTVLFQQVDFPAENVVSLFRGWGVVLNGIEKNSHWNLHLSGVDDQGGPLCWGRPVICLIGCQLSEVYEVLSHNLGETFELETIKVTRASESVMVGKNNATLRSTAIAPFGE